MDSTPETNKRPALNAADTEKMRSDFIAGAQRSATEESDLGVPADPAGVIFRPEWQDDAAEF